MNKAKLLLTEDDPNLGTILTEYLQAKGYAITHCRNGKEGLEACNDNQFDLCILDVMMPELDGFTLAKEIRKDDKHTPIIFLTAKTMKEDTIEGFKSGADDYITKPFSMEELLYRIEAILRRTSGNDIKSISGGVYNIGKYKFDYNHQQLMDGESSQKLTSKEADLLKKLCENANDVMERNEALREIWGDDNYYNSRSMDVYITKLRKSLKDDPNIEILNVHGRGFKLLIDG